MAEDPYDVARALVRGLDGPGRATALHDHRHDVAVTIARRVLRISPAAMLPVSAGQHVRPWSATAAYRRRCARYIHHCWHPLHGMGLDWCCCVCGAPVEHPGPTDACVLCRLPSGLVIFS